MHTRNVNVRKCLNFLGKLFLEGYSYILSCMEAQTTWERLAVGTSAVTECQTSLTYFKIIVRDPSQNIYYRNNNFQVQFHK